MKYQVQQSLVGTNPLTGEEICLRPGDQIEWCPIEGPRMVEAGIFVPVASNATPETPEAPKAKTRAKETR
jgi:hypothetical protein